MKYKAILSPLIGAAVLVNALGSYSVRAQTTPGGSEQVRSQIRSRQ